MPAPHRRRRGIKIAAIAAAVLIAIGGLVLLVRQVYFLGTDDSGRVAVYRGLPYELPLGINLYSEQEVVGVQASTLSPERQEVVTEHKLRSKDDAVDIANDIEQREGAVPAAPAPAAPAPSAKKQAAAKKKKKQAANAGSAAGQP
jgi:protein phosphatase